MALYPSAFTYGPAGRSIPAWSALASVVLLGLAVRLYGLTSYGFWFDEAYHIELVRLPTVGDMLGAVLANPPSDPLYVLLLRPWAALVGYGEGSVRLLTVILSTVTLPAAFWLGKQVAGRAAGLVGALLLAVSPYTVEFGQEAALYALASLTTTLALAAGWRWRATGVRRDAALYVALGIVAIYSHYVVAAILVLFAALSLQSSTGPRKASAPGWLAANAAIFAAWLPWLVALAGSWLTTGVPRATLRHPATPSEVVGALVQYTSGTSALLQGEDERMLQVVGLVAGTGLLALGWLAGRETVRRGVRLVSVISGLVFFVPALVSAASGLWLFVPHFMLFMLPALCVVLAVGYSLFAGRRAWTYFALLALWLVAQVWGLALYYRHPPHGADGLREITAALRQDARRGDAVLVMPPILEPTLRRYYGGEIHGLPSEFDLRSVYLPYGPDEWYARSLAAFDAAAESHERIWLVYRPETDEAGRLLTTIRSRLRLSSERSYPYAALYLFTR